MQEYRSGHNEAVLKTVRPKATGVRIPLPAPTKTLTEPSVKVFCLLAQEERNPRGVASGGEKPERIRGMMKRG